MRVEKLIKSLEQDMSNKKVFDSYGYPINDIRIETNEDALPNGRGVYLYSSEFAKPIAGNKLIEQLKKADPKMQVMNSDGSRLYWVVPKTNITALPNGEGIYFEYISNIDVEAVLDSLFIEENLSEYDAFLELGEIGFTLLDLYNTSKYEYAKEFSETHSWEEY